MLDAYRILVRDAAAAAAVPYIDIREAFLAALPPPTPLSFWRGRVRSDTSGSTRLRLCPPPPPHPPPPHFNPASPGHPGRRASQPGECCGIVCLLVAGRSDLLLGDRLPPEPRALPPHAAPLLRRSGRSSRRRSSRSRSTSGCSLPASARTDVGSKIRLPCAAQDANQFFVACKKLWTDDRDGINCRYTFDILFCSRCSVYTPLPRLVASSILPLPYHMATVKGVARVMVLAGQAKPSPALGQAFGERHSSAGSSLLLL